MARTVLLFSLLLLVACGGGPAVAQAQPAHRIRLIHVEGLSPDLLTAYLGRAGARQPDRALHRWLALGPPSAQPEPTRGAIIAGLSVLPSAGGPLAATLLTGDTPATHGAWADADAPKGLNPKHTLINAPWARDKSPDAARLAALKKSRAAVAYARLTGIGHAIAQRGPSAAAGALAALDQALAQTWAQLPKGTSVILVGAHGVGALAPAQPLTPGPIGTLLGIDPTQIRPAGGLVALPELLPAQAQKLATVDAIQAVLRLDAKGVQRWDRDLNRLRPLTAHDPLGPEAVARLRASAAPGTWVAVAARRGEAFDFVAEGAEASRRLLGGLNARESALVFVLAGEAFPTGPKALAPTEIARLLTDRAPSAASAAIAEPGLIPWITAYGGPQFETDATTFAGLQRLQRGVAAARAGLLPQAWALLSAAKVPAEAEPWRALFAWRVAQQLAEVDPKPAAPKTGRAAQLAVLWGTDPALSRAMGLQLGALGGAFNALGAAPEPSLCQPSPPDGAALSTAGAAFAHAALPGEAAIAYARHALNSRDRAVVSAARTAALDLLERPEAAWAVPRVTGMIINNVVLMPLLGDTAGPDDLRRASDRQLLDLQRVITADTGPGAADRTLGRLSALALTSLGADPALLAETLDLALGQDRAGAAALVGALAAQGGLTSLISGGGMQIIAMLQMMEQALGPIEGPIDALSAEARLAHAVPLLLKAVLHALRGRLPAAQAPLEQADALLDTAALLALRNANRGKDDPSALLLWGPAIKVITQVGRAGLAAFSDRALAERHGQAAVATLMLWARDELRQAELGVPFEPHVAALETLLNRAVTLALTDDAGRPAAAKAVAQAAAALPVALTAGQGDAARWLALAGIIARDVVWALGHTGVSAQPEPAVLQSATQALETLSATWQPESRFLSASLMLLRATQRTLPALPELLAAKTLDLATVLRKTPHLAAAATALRSELAQRGTPDVRMAGVAQGALDLLLVDLLATMLETKLASLADPDVILAVLEGRTRALLSASEAVPGSQSTPVLALLEGWLLAASNRPGPAAEVMARGRAATAKTTFADYPWLFDLHAARWYAEGQQPREALRALDRADAACEGLGWLTAQARARKVPHGPASGALFDQARLGATRWRTGGALAELKISLLDGDAMINVTVQMQLAALLLRGQSGTLQLAAGNITDDPPAVVQWQLRGDGDATSFVVDTLSQEAWHALVAGDDAHGDRTLSHLADLLDLGVDPGWYTAQPGPSPVGPVAHPLIRAPHALLWVATLAELRGHTLTTNRLWRHVRPSDALTAPHYGTQSFCDAENEGLTSTPRANAVRCSAPSELVAELSKKDRARFGALVHLRVLKLDGQLVKPAQWKKTLQAAQRWKALPKWLGRKPPKAVRAAQALLSGNTDTLAEVYAGPFGCGALQFKSSQPAAMIAPLERCAPMAAQFATLGYAAQQGDFVLVERLLRFAASIHTLRDRVLPAGFQMVARAVSDQPNTTAQAKVALQFADLADTLGQINASVDLRALALNASGGAPSPALLKAAIAGHGRDASRRFIKQRAWPSP